MKIRKTYIDGVCVVETSPLVDSRGEFYRAFCDQALAAELKGKSIRQANLSKTLAVGTIRGMHFQYPPQAETKLIRCLAGKVWDVAVDLRQGSPTLLHWYAQELSPENALMMIIPEGCAHGFQVLEANSQMLYLHTMPYCKDGEGGVRFDDPALKINWPLSAKDVSPRDSTHPLLDGKFAGIKL